MKEALLYASTFIIEDDLMWFVPIRYNYLCCYNFTTEKVEKKFRLPEGNYYPRMHDNILSYEGKLYLIPFSGSNVLIFDKMTESFQQISTAPFDSIKYKFCAATIYQNTLYMFPERVAAEIENPYVVIRVDLTGEEDVQVVELDVPVAPAGKPYYEVFDRQYFATEGFVYILLQRTNKVLEYSLVKNTTKIYEVGSCENRYATMYMDGDIFYFIDQEGDVTVWDKVKNKISKYKNEIPGYAVEKKELFAAFSASFKYGNSVYFVPRFANKIVRFYEKKVSECYFQNIFLNNSKEIDKLVEHGRYVYTSLLHDKVYFWNLYDYRFYTINLVDEISHSEILKIWFDGNEIEFLYDELTGIGKKNYNEDVSCYNNLCFYLKKISLNKMHDEIKNKGMLGEKIYHSI